MARVPLLGGAYQMRSLIAGAQRSVNLFSENNPGEAQSPVPVTTYPTPGLRFLGRPSDQPGTPDPVPVPPTPPDPVSMLFTTQPSGVTAGATFSPAPVVTFYLENGDVATGYSGDVTISIWTSGAVCEALTLSGTLTVTAVAGIGTFSDISLDNTAVGTRLRADQSDLGLADITSSFDVIGTGRPAIWTSGSAQLQSPGFTLSAGAQGIAMILWRCNGGMQLNYDPSSSGLQFAVPGGTIAQIWNAAGQPIMQTGASPVADADIWHQDVMSWDTVGRSLQWYRDGVDVASGVTDFGNAGPVSFSAAGNLYLNFNGLMSDCFVGFSASFFDLSNPTNLAKLWSGGKAVDISGNPTAVTGTAPLVYLHNTIGNAAAYLTNQGSLGGTFTSTSAAFVDAPDGPF